MGTKATERKNSMSKTKNTAESITKRLNQPDERISGKKVDAKEVLMLTLTKINKEAKPQHPILLGYN